MSQLVRHLADNVSFLFQVSGCLILQWKNLNQNVVKGKMLIVQLPNDTSAAAVNVRIGICVVEVRFQIVVGRVA
jgi:hypothetical protein